MRVRQLAVPLTRYLTTGEYARFDLDELAIRWCRRAIARPHPNFWFAHADVANAHYNPRGTVLPTDFRFPCADRSVDLVFISSVFTHLLPAAADHYVSASARVLKHGGRMIVSLFLLDDAIRPRLHDPLVQPQFHHWPEHDYAVASREDPEAAIAYEVDTVQAAFAARDLEVVHVERGSWRAAVNPITYQDLIVVQRRGAASLAAGVVERPDV